MTAALPGHRIFEFAHEGLISLGILSNSLALQNAEQERKIIKINQIKKLNINLNIITIKYPLSWEINL